MSPVLMQIGPLQIRYYSLMYMIALYLGIEIGKHSAKKYGINPELIKSFGFWVITSGIIGARIYYIFLKWDYYRNNMEEVFAIWRGISGLAIHGGIIGAGVGVLLFSWIRKINFWDLVDIAAPPTLLGQAIGRIGNLINGETHGVPVFTPLSVLFKGNFESWWASYKAHPFSYYPNLVPWGIVFPPGTPAGYEFPNILLHPTMIYEMVLNTIGFFVLYFYFRKKDLGRGSIAGLYIIFYGVIRTIVSFFRAEDLYFMGIRAPYIANAIFILVGSLIVYFANRSRKI